MSQKNVEVVRKSNEGLESAISLLWNAGDMDGLGCRAHAGRPFLRRIESPCQPATKETFDARSRRYGQYQRP